VERANDQAIDPPLPPFPALTARPARRSSISWNLLGFAIGFAAALKLFGPQWMWLFARRTNTVGELALLFTALNAAIVLHEAGHLLMAWALDFDVLGGSLGPLRAIRMHGRWSLQFSFNLFSGSAIVVPRRSESNWRARMLGVVAAGPAATFLATAFSALLLIVFATSESWFARFLGASFELNFFLFFLGLFPNARGARLQNDARLFCTFLRDTAEANEILLYHLIGQFQIAGVRPRDYPKQLIHKLAQAQGRPEMCVSHANTIVLWALDRGDIKTADAWERRAMDLAEFCDWKQQNNMFAGSASFDLIVREDAISAKNKLAEVQIDTLSPRWYRHRIAAVYWLAAGNIPQALAEIARAQYEFPNRLPYYDFERMLLTRLHRKAIATQPEELATRYTSRAI
jgi:Peptidase family M50